MPIKSNDDMKAHHDLAYELINTGIDLETRNNTAMAIEYYIKGIKELKLAMRSRASSYF